MSHWPQHGRIEGAIVMIGFESIGKETLLSSATSSSTRSISSSSTRTTRTAGCSTSAASNSRAMRTVANHEGYGAISAISTVAILIWGWANDREVA